MDKSLANFKQNPEAQFLVLVINPIPPKGGPIVPPPPSGFLKSVKNWDWMKAHFFATFSYI